MGDTTEINSMDTFFGRYQAAPMVGSAKSNFGHLLTAAGMTGISVTAVILQQTDKIVLSKILPLEMFGYYTLATVVAGALYHFIGPVFSALFPRFSQLVSINDQAGLLELYHKSCQLMSVMILPAVIVVSLFSSEILLLWTDVGYILNQT